jgi:hypothetical protein
MHRKRIILGMLILLSACSTIKNTGTVVNNPSYENFLDLNKTKASNISESDFNIIKAIVTISSSEDKNEFLINCKYKRPDNYLISIRSKTGIEAARIFITEDTILINDKLNRRLYSGSSSYLYTKYGVDIKCLRLLFGDFVTDGNVTDNSFKCEKNFINISGVINDKRIEYRINCSSGKVSDAFIIKGIDEGVLHISFGRFRNFENKSVPQQIEIKDRNTSQEIKIEIEKLSLETVKELLFIPGNGFEKILLK